MKTNAPKTRSPSPHAAEPAASPLGARVGRIVEVRDGGVPHVDFEGNPHGPLPARLALSAADAHRLATGWDGVDVLLVFSAQDLCRPLVVGIVRETFEECLLHAEEWAGFEALRLRATGELSLQCGEAKLVLRHDGVVSIVGREVVSRARGRHRIRGGTVEIN